MSEVKTYDWSDISSHNTRDNLWMVIEGKVYDVTKFLDEHPGGEEVMVEQGGQDATEAFEEIGHSDDARDLLKTMYLGDLKPSAGKADKAASKVAAGGQATKDAVKQSAGGSSSIFFALVPVVVVVAFAVYKFLEKQH
ncbi:hypothetical protein SpCBS45565_g00210 [Spizellomyces sp. 'palustris']|nr:hypothetical protein SpCBS45565_g00210 [Spizellomyces sp. 'palustris']